MVIEEGYGSPVEEPLGSGCISIVSYSNKRTTNNYVWPDLYHSHFLTLEHKNHHFIFLAILGTDVDNDHEPLPGLYHENGC